MIIVRSTFSEGKHDKRRIGVAGHCPGNPQVHAVRLRRGSPT